MKFTKLFLLALAAFIFGTATGAASLYYWASANEMKFINNHILTALIPGQIKEIYLLMGIEKGFEARPAKKSREALCRLIVIKAVLVNQTIKMFSSTANKNEARNVDKYLFLGAPSVKEIQQYTNCEAEWLTNNAEKMQGGVNSYQ